MICKNCQKEFNISESDKKIYQKLAVPEPDLCLDCRWQKLLAFWPFGNFYQRKCDKSGEGIISTMPENAPFPVYKKKYWLGDDWQAPSAEINWDQPFLEQLAKLQKKTPHFNMLEDGTNTNCDYCDDIYSSKNCYLTRSCAEGEDLYFCYRVIGCKDSFDSVYSYNLERCYSCTRCWHCYNVSYSLESHDSIDSSFLYDCRGCKNCFMCWNLRNAEYCIENKKYSPEEYAKKMAGTDLSSWKTVNELKNLFKELLQNFAIHRSDFNLKTINCVGNYLTECKNCVNHFFGEQSEDCLNLIRATGNKDTYDSIGAYKMQLCYLTSQCAECYNAKMGNYLIRCHDCEYLDQCEDCHDCFGCVGLRKKAYCILNKQHSEEEYPKVVEKLKDKMKDDGEYGQSLPWSMLHTGYNDSIAYHYYPETKEKIEAMGGFWQDEMEKEVSPDLQSDKLPDSIKDVDEADFVGKTVKCPQTGKVFRYIPQEIKFYKANNIPLPRYYYNYRLTENFKQMTPLTGREINCGKCAKKVTTFYPADWDYKNIFCEECYQKEIY